MTDPNFDRNSISTLSLTTSSLSSTSSAPSTRRQSKPVPAAVANQSHVYTITKKRRAPAAYTLTVARRPPLVAEHIDDVVDQPTIPVDEHDTLRLEVDPAEAEPYALFDDATGAKLSQMAPLERAGERLQRGVAPPAALNLREAVTGTGAVLATVKNVNPGSSKASRSHIDMHVVDATEKNVLMAIRGTNERHVVMVGPRGRSFIGWMSKEDSDAEDEEHWTISLKVEKDLIVVMWLVVAIDEFYNVTPEKMKSRKTAAVAGTSRAVKVSSRRRSLSGREEVTAPPQRRSTPHGLRRLLQTWSTARSSGGRKSGAATNATKPQPASRPASSPTTTPKTRTPTTNESKPSTPPVFSNDPDDTLTKLSENLGVAEMEKDEVADQKLQLLRTNSSYRGNIWQAAQDPSLKDDLVKARQQVYRTPLAGAEQSPNLSKFSRATDGPRSRTARLDDEGISNTRSQRPVSTPVGSVSKMAQRFELQGATQ
eukprot:CAMPEP_0198309756 /NCGR_PEP_ID=MMETSP1450-20131203/2034_1 /TAXON_ID=753684 ORGANISM="Madagascaria erythrocladiodes, Strain CCMP3234" /NCGR_SAMPLE_ID=MMETSP1450 /ASSEMBLY_ACC=CAM_ASM_001115 /LENGTH=482 /DNA_ID=CAMNT_0044012531 /DNA_START=12 /DNA_END=1460 /DNA_ORIENTATION=+